MNIAASSSNSENMLVVAEPAANEQQLPMNMAGVAGSSRSPTTKTPPSTSNDCHTTNDSHIECRTRPTSRPTSVCPRFAQHSMMASGVANQKSTRTKVPPPPRKAMAEYCGMSVLTTMYAVLSAATPPSVANSSAYMPVLPSVKYKPSNTAQPSSPVHACVGHTAPSIMRGGDGAPTGQLPLTRSRGDAYVGPLSAASRPTNSSSVAPAPAAASPSPASAASLKSSAPARLMPPTSGSADSRTSLCGSGGVTHARVGGAVAVAPTKPRPNELSPSPTSVGVSVSPTRSTLGGRSLSVTAVTGVETSSTT
mmetsp:Transcript_24231/g.84138  ORF Transcript_24231/g.84138 Transcript_24231/m.84138 type:complete len:309 (-) Transcript_24231:1387-2313(-)